MSYSQLPSNYLHYRWKNAVASDNYNYVLRKLKESKQTIMNRQYSKGMKAMKKQYASSGVFSQQDLAMLDAKYSDFRLVDLSEAMQGGAVNLDTAVSSTNSADASQVLEAWLKLRKSLTKGAEFQKNLLELATFLRTSSPGLVKQIENYIITNYQSVKTQVPQSEALTKMVAELLSTPNGTIRYVNPQDAELAAIRTPTKRFLLLVYALGGDVDTSNKKAIENSIKTIGSGNLNNIQGDLGELSRRVIQADAEEMEGTLLSTLDQAIDTVVTGSNKVAITKKFDAATTDMFKIAQANSKRGGEKLSFSDAGITFQKTQQKSDKAIVSNMNLTITGVNVKTTTDVRISDKTNKTTVKELKLQDRTSLLTLLARELGFKGKTIQRLLQIAVAAEGDTAQLDEYWRGLQQQVAYGMLSNVLVGYGNQTKNCVMQINNTFIPMEDFFTYLVQGIAKEGSGSINMHASGFPDRSDFVSMNQWNSRKTSADNTLSGIIRSNELYPKAIAKLASAKITIKLRAFNISALSGLMS